MHHVFAPAVSSRCHCYAVQAVAKSRLTAAIPMDNPYCSRERRQTNVVQAVAKFGAKNWSSVADMVETKNGKQCRERWINHINPVSASSCTLLMHPCATLCISRVHPYATLCISLMQDINREPWTHEDDMVRGG